MNFLNWRRESRNSLENPSVPISSPKILQVFGINEYSAAGEHVTVNTALGVPSVWAAVNFLSGTMAKLPLDLYRRKRDGSRDRVSSPLATLLHDAVNDDMTSFAWRKYLFEQVLTEGRGLSFIERNARGSVINIWPLELSKTTIVRRDGLRFYEYKGGTHKVTYAANEVIDLAFMLLPDLLKHRSPILCNKEAIALAQALTKYGGKFFSNGGVPPFAIKGNFQTEQAMRRAMDDLDAAVKKAASEQRQALALPEGLDIEQIGVNPEDMQMIEAQRFCVEQIARIYSLPPTFLQDLTHGTFSNTEQQDLHFVKHTVTQWVEQFEKELNLKLFGRSRTSLFVEINVDGLLRGDFKTRMEGYARGVQSGVYMPNEARRMENRPDAEGGDQLFMQGATVPIDQAGAMTGNSGGDSQDTGDQDDDET
jgi:HK97 family phage portal protein